MQLVLLITRAVELEVVGAAGVHPHRLMVHLVQGNVRDARQCDALEAPVAGVRLHIHVFLVRLGFNADTRIHLPKVPETASIRVHVQEHEGLGVADNLGKVVPVVVVGEDGWSIGVRAGVHAGDQVVHVLNLCAIKLGRHALARVNEEIARLALRAVLVKIQADLRLLADGKIVDHGKAKALGLRVRLLLTLNLHDLAVVFFDRDLHLPHVVRSGLRLGPLAHQLPQHGVVVL
mmetsp:Transcript_91296/g.263450  ORF Transcript_91296/g.263450 Transcript_91296/m.263450 type:complete len:233 (+) Transcript_91296:712-1410(+)